MTTGTRHIALVTDTDAISLQRARDIADSLTAQGFAVSQLDGERSLVSRLAKMTPDLVFNAAFRSRLSDGRVRAVCDLLGLASTHSGYAASALAADRHLSKMIFKSAGIPVTDHVLADRAEAGSTHVLVPPYVAKPRFVGTGGTPVIVRYEQDLPPSELLSEDWADAEEVMIERFLPGQTLEAFIMGDVLLGVSARTDALKGKDSETLIPASISPKIYEKCTRLALRAHGVLGCRGVTALTLRFNENQAFGEPVALGFTTQPDLGRAAPLVLVAARAGHSFDELLRWIVEDASYG